MQATHIYRVVNETEFLAGYDPRTFPPAAVAVDLVIVAVIDSRLSLFVMKRAEQPQRGKLALPGSIVQPEEDLDACAQRTAVEKVGLRNCGLHQIGAFGAPKRDPRMRMVSIAYLALTEPEVLLSVVRDNTDDRVIATLRSKAEVDVLINKRPVRLAFDHNDIVTAAIRQLGQNVNRDAEAFQLLPKEFTLLDLQTVFEAVLSENLNKSWFRKHHLATGCLEPTGRKAARGAQRPAELYRYRDCS